MSQYNRFPRISSTTKINLEDEDVLDYLHDIPSNLDVTLNGGRNRTYLSPNPAKTPDLSLLDPSPVRRLSTSTLSSVSRARSLSLISNTSPPSSPRTWKSLSQNFWHQNQGLFLVTFSQLFGALMNVTTRLLELEGEGMDPMQILFVRQGLTVLLCSAWMWWSKVPDFPLGKSGVRGLLVVRAFSGFFGIFGMYYSLQYLPVADAVVITFLAPSVASYGCYVFLHEPFPRTAQYASLISLLGVVMIARPTSFFSSSTTPTSITTPTNTTSPSSTSSASSSSSSSTTTYPTPTSSQRTSAVLFALLGVLGSAGAFTSIRLIGPRTHPLISVNYFSFYCVLISTSFLTFSKPLGLSTELGFKMPVNGRQWGMLLFLGCCGFVMQFLLTMGLASDSDSGSEVEGGGDGDERSGGRVGERGKEKAKGGSRATNMIYTNMLFALGLDGLVFGTIPSWWSLGGSGLILGSAIWVAVSKKEVEGSTDRSSERSRGVGVEDEEMTMLPSSASSFEREDGRDVEERRLLSDIEGAGRGDAELMSEDADARF